MSALHVEASLRAFCSWTVARLPLLLSTLSTRGGLLLPLGLLHPRCDAARPPHPPSCPPARRRMEESVLLAERTQREKDEAEARCAAPTTP